MGAYCLLSVENKIANVFGFKTFLRVKVFYSGIVPIISATNIVRTS